MANGYVGKLLFVDLSNGTMSEEDLPEELTRDFMGGYGLGAKIVYDRMPGGVDPLGPDNMLGFTTGPLGGTDALTSGRKPHRLSVAGVRYHVSSRSSVSDTVTFQASSVAAVVFADIEAGCDFDLRPDPGL